MRSPWQGIERKLRQLAEWQKARLVLENDFSQLSPRPVRDEYGDQQAALILQPQNDYFVEFTRAGWHNPLSQHRSQLQRVAYQVKDGQLLRYYWPLLDLPPGMQAISQRLMSDVDNVQLRLLDRQQQWHIQWPPKGNRQQQLLKAAELSITHKLFGKMVIQLPVPAGSISRAEGGLG